MTKREYEPGELVVTEELGVGPGVLAVVRCEWSYIPPGTFRMGSTDAEKNAFDNEKSSHQVTLTRGFLMQRTPVTEQQWVAVMGAEPTGGGNPRRPKLDVSWFQAMAYCNALSRLSGMEEAYLLSPNQKGFRQRKNPMGYRLPTEAEWEYACRAGTARRLHGNLDDIAWHWPNTVGEDVEQKRPNAWNLHDMLGYKWEWTQDRYGNYTKESQTDPQGPARGFNRACRGGSSLDNSSRISAARRSERDPFKGNVQAPYCFYFGQTLYVGFRPVRTLP